MRYTMKAGMLYEENRQEPLIHMKGVFSSPEKHICLPNEEWVLRTDIRNLPAPPGKRSDVRFRRYVILDPAGAEIASGKPDYAQGDDPEVVGWPICRMPRVDHAAVTIDGKPYALVMHNSQNYGLKDPSGYTVVQIMHRGLCGGWNIDADEAFSPGILCGLFAFCRYMEHENEFMIV